MNSRTLLRRSLFTLAGLAAALAAAVGFALARAEFKQHRSIELKVGAIAIPDDPAALERGRYLFLSRGCIDCHGAQGGGKVLINDGKGLHLRGPNIAQGSPTVASYRVEDWVRAIRHGVKPDGRPALIMPSEDYNRLSNEDLGALIAHLRRLPRTEGGPAVIELPLPFRAMYGMGLIQDAAEKIDHGLPPSPPMASTVSVANGAYVATMCIGCHGPGLSGGKIPGTPPDWPPASNLTPGQGSAMPQYRTPEQFVAMMHSGQRPDGSAVSKVMPFGALKEMSDTDLRAIYAYLQTVPAKPQGQR
ncbi:MAG TPA: c-type cytochrome [Roseateles sp.]|nr:c-type cytochrome [Roseateles sp.]